MMQEAREKQTIEISDRDGRAAQFVGATAVREITSNPNEKDIGRKDSGVEGANEATNEWAINDGPPLIEATLIQSEKLLVDEEPAVVVEERRVCGINIAGCGVNQCIVLVVDIVVLAAIAMGVVVGKGSSVPPDTSANHGDGADPGWNIVGEEEDMVGFELDYPLGGNYTLDEYLRPSETSVSLNHTEFKIALSEDGTAVATSESGLFWNSTRTTVGRIRVLRDFAAIFHGLIQIIQPTAEENYTDFGQAMTMSSSGSTITFGASTSRNLV